jgi:hypothetical protein
VSPPRHIELPRKSTTIDLLEVAEAFKEVTDERIPIPYDDDVKFERRIDALLWRCTDPKID